MRPVTASEGIDLLLERGVKIVVVDANTVSVELNGIRYRARVHVRRSPPSRWDVQRDSESDRLRDPTPGLLLYVVAKATAGLVEAAYADARIVLVSVQDQVVVVSGARIEDAFAGLPETSHLSATGRGRVAWGRFAVLRMILRSPRPRTQIALAAECGVSQVAVSNALRALGTGVTRDAAGWRALQPDRLWGQFLAEYPGPQGITNYWLGLDTLMRQAEAARDAASGEGVLVSGDVAADLFAPWRVGRRAVVYARTGLALAEVGFSETTRETATLECVVPADPTIWSTAVAWAAGESGWSADPVLVAWDVQRTGGPDAADAVNKIRQTVLAGFA